MVIVDGDNRIRHPNFTPAQTWQKIRCVSLPQPWATLTAEGIIPFAMVDTSAVVQAPWGPLIIHASQRETGSVGDAFKFKLERCGYDLPTLYPQGVTVGIADVSDRIPVTQEVITRAGRNEKLLNVWKVGRTALRLSGATPCPPITLQGNVGLWTPPEGAARYLLKVLDGEIKSWSNQILEVIDFDTDYVA